MTKKSRGFFENPIPYSQEAFRQSFKRRPEVVRVPFVYGGFFYVAKSDLENPRKTYLPLYTIRGERWEDTPSGQRAAKAHRATTLHRDNIGACCTEEQERFAAPGAVCSRCGTDPIDECGVVHCWHRECPL